MGACCTRLVFGGKPERVAAATFPEPLPPIPDAFDDVLTSDFLREKFRKFLAKRFASENFAFYEQLELYEKMGTSANAQRYHNRAGEGLVNKYVVQESAQGVNISGPTRNRLLDVANFDKNTFAQAKKELHELLATNFFGPFKLMLENEKN